MLNDTDNSNVFFTTDSNNALLAIGYPSGSIGTSLRITVDAQDIVLPSYSVSSSYGSYDIKILLSLGVCEQVTVYNSIFRNITASGDDPIPCTTNVCPPWLSRSTPTFTSALWWMDSYTQGRAPNITIVDSTFDLIRAGSNGGAVMLANQPTSSGFTAISIIDSNFTNVITQGSGSAVSIRCDSIAAMAPLSPPVTFSGCLFESNSALQEGGALSLGPLCLYTITDSVFVDNIAGTSGGALSLEMNLGQNATLNITDSIFLNNQAGVFTGLTGFPRQNQVCGGAMKVSEAGDEG